MAPGADCGQRLKAWRTAQGLSQRDLASAIDVSQSYIGNIEAGRSDPSRNFLVSLQKKFGVRTDYILYGEGKPSLLEEERFEPSATEPVQSPSQDAILLVICGGAVSQEYASAGISLPRETHLEEAERMARELRSRMNDPSDGDEMDALLPMMREQLRERLTR